MTYSLLYHIHMHWKFYYDCVYILKISIVFKPSVYICNNVCLDVSNSAFKDNVVCNPK